jgi:hypothetical protein
VFEITTENARLELSNRLRHATSPMMVADAFGEGDGGGGASGGKLGGAGSNDSNAIKATSGTSVVGCIPLYGTHALNSLTLRQNFAFDPGTEPPSATASFAAAIRCFK